MTNWNYIIRQSESVTAVDRAVYFSSSIEGSINGQTKTALTAELKDLRARLAAIDPQINAIERTWSDAAVRKTKQVNVGTPTEPEVVGYNRALGIRKNLITRIREVTNELGKLDSLITQASNASVGTAIAEASSATSSTEQSVITELSSDVLVNAPMPKIAYFRNIQSLLADKSDQILYAGNTPKNISDAQEQWGRVSSGYSSGNKGMIQTWQSPSGWSNPVDAEGRGIFGENTSVQRYGFRFLYNPETISMVYGGVADFDITTLTSGITKTMPNSPNVFQSTIAFNIPLNRMFDMAQLSKNNGTFNSSTGDIYPFSVETSELRGIYNKGTMYDFEYLLKSILGLELPTQFRGLTSDIGFLYGRPVELHLGSALRYLVSISSIQIDHILFDSRMVPIFSNVSMTVNRIPDYAASTVTEDSNGGSRGGAI